MLNKKFIIGALLFLLVISAVTFYFVKRQASQKQTAQNSGQNQTGTGGLNTLPTGTATQPRGGFLVVSDPSQPYASISPRAPETAASNNYQPTTTGSNGSGGNGSNGGSGSNGNGGSGNNSASGSGNNGSQLSYNDAYNQGLVADSNGQYKQVVSASGFNQYEVNQFSDYNLSDSAFLQKYYPDYNNVINNQTPGQLAQNAVDPVVVDNSDGLTDVPEIPDSAMTNISQVNTSQAQVSYLQQISALTAPFDLYNDSNLITDSGNLTASQASDYYKRAQSVIDALKNIQVPSALLPLTKAYLKLYINYQYMLDDETKLNALGAGKSSDALLQKFTDDSGNFSDALTTISLDVQYLKVSLGQ